MFDRVRNQFTQAQTLCTSYNGMSLKDSDSIVKVALASNPKANDLLAYWSRVPESANYFAVGVECLLTSKGQRQPAR